MLPNTGVKSLDDRMLWQDTNTTIELSTGMK